MRKLTTIVLLTAAMAVPAFAGPKQEGNALLKDLQPTGRGQVSERDEFRCRQHYQLRDRRQEGEDQDGRGQEGGMPGCSGGGGLKCGGSHSGGYRIPAIAAREASPCQKDGPAAWAGRMAKRR